ncbi:adenylate/guanylate cyclase domain-containing protein [Spirulina sp. CS-785/01]|uniref:adenylate/guanylate cyclase domain-containing protein n=1 Tax=Spirulina sp. CS-785/01 TaxID=3021716 RepID=UPI00232D2E54|nr:adenylate/guanylate cyclase domain-containing protein [Spirulina sp. CS-785/01]MDB9313734.1 adenylate/guanylate cyclase domain-containing protein [Spirulina sp. CS-785/01]
MWRGFRTSLPLILGLVIIAFLWVVPLQAQHPLNPITLNQNWQYRLGDSPTNAKGLPQLLDESPTSADWQPLSVPSHLEIPPGTNFFWLAIPLPSKNWSSPSLYLRGIPHILEGYFQGQPLFTFKGVDADNNLIHSEGAFPIISLPDPLPQDTLYLRVHTDEALRIPLGYTGLPLIGNKPDLIRHFFLADSLQIALGFLFVFCGIFPLAISLYKRVNNLYTAFGLFNLVLGIYTLTFSNVVRLILNYGMAVTFIHHSAFHLLPSIILIFYEQAFSRENHNIIRRLWQIHLFYAPLALILAGKGLITWNEAALPTQFLGIFSAFCLIFFACKNALKGKPEAKIFTMGFSSFLIAAIHDIIVYVFPKLFIGLRLFPWGMLLLIFCLALILERRFTHAQNYLKIYNKSLQRFVPYEFFEALEKESIIDVKLGDQVQKEMGILFSDIRSFTSISESMPPKDNFNFLNAYLSQVGPVIRQNHGFIDKYIGDAVMALFPNSPEDAMNAALAMQQQVQEFNAVSQEKGYPNINIGIGVHWGSLMLGTIGEIQRMETTVIADAVNLASRLEDSTKQYYASFLVSDEMLNKLANPAQYCYRFLGQILVKGKREPVGVYEIYDHDPPALKAFKTETKEQFEMAIQFYGMGKFKEAKAIFQELWGISSQDRVVWVFLFVLLQKV